MNVEGTVCIDKGTVSERISDHYHRQSFEQALVEHAHREELLRVLSRYIHWCSVFGGCQASLAGELAVRQDLFRDPQEPDAVGDTSVEVAAGVFFGAIDEFGDRESHATGPSRPTHRSLAQATLKGLARFYGRDLAALRRETAGHAATISARERVLQGYGTNQVMDEPKLFRAFGFHVATETLADEEFRTLDGFFRAHRSDIARFLSELRVPIGGQELPAYFWISRHTVADAEHFDAALQAANLALLSYAGAASAAQAREWILLGIEEAAVLEHDYMSALDKD